jgi:uncharacterized protein YcbX
MRPQPVFRWMRRAQATLPRITFGQVSNMPHIVALYRYPVKGFTAERCESLRVLAEGRIAGDRALAFRFADSGLPPSAWSRKHGFAVLVNAPGLARLTARFDRRARRLAIALDHDVLADEPLDDAGRERLCAAIERYVVDLPDNPLTGHPERTPLQLIGDGFTPRYQDNEQGQITLHSRESLAAVAAVSDPHLDEIRFRSNIAIEGARPWEELEWIGRTLKIGSLEFEVVKAEVRCLATHANPATGVRDLPLMQTLVSQFGQRQPTFAVALMTRGAGGEIHVGDAVSVTA